MINRIQRSLSAAASFAALCLVGAGAQAADCFDRDAVEIKAGNATAVTGPEVGLQRSDADGFVRPRAGADLFTGDRVRTGQASHLQLKLCDWSTYTFSPQSESEISEFYSAEGARRRRVVNFFRGGFRLASGRNTAPDSTEVRIQESGVTMGVRGTSVLLVELDGVVYALLEGPVLDNTAYQPRGEVGFWTGENRDAIIASLRRPGWVVTIGPDGVSEPFRASPDLLRRIYEAFVPVIPEEDGQATDDQFTGDPITDSGQGTQEGDQGAEFARNDSQRESNDTTNQPDQGCGSTIPLQDCQDQTTPPPPPPPMLNVGDILPLDALEDFAAAQAQPDGHIFALTNAQLFEDQGTGPMLVDEGVALIQINVDWASRTVAPQALASFVRFDFSVANPADLTVPDEDFTIPFEVEVAYDLAVFLSSNLPFASGAGGLSVFEAPTFTFTIRQGVGDTVTADVNTDFSAQDNQSVTYTGVVDIGDLTFMPGTGDLAYFFEDFAIMLTPTELEGVASSGTSILAGGSEFLLSVDNGATLLDGASYGQFEIDFDNRTVGGGSSFIALTAAPDPSIGGVKALQYAPLDQVVAFDGGLFGLTFYPLSTLTSDNDVLRGEAFITSDDGLFGDIAAILAAQNGSAIYTSIGLNEPFPAPFPIATIVDLDAQVGVLGPIDFRFDGTVAGAGVVSSANLFEADGSFAAGGTASASIDINFANRTIGGGNSFVAVDINDMFAGITLNFVETISAIGFDDSVKGVGVFGFDGSDFSGTNMDALLLLVRDGPTIGAGERADIIFDFNDGAGRRGQGDVRNMPLLQGATAPPVP